MNKKSFLIWTELCRNNKNSNNINSNNMHKCGFLEGAQLFVCYLGGGGGLLTPALNQFVLIIFIFPLFSLVQRVVLNRSHKSELTQKPLRWLHIL